MISKGGVEWVVFLFYTRSGLDIGSVRGGGIGCWRGVFLSATK